MSQLREVRVRREYIKLYPELPADTWVPAREFADVIVLRARRARGFSTYQRTPDPRHFEFRGGPAEARPPEFRTRVTD
jgi:hypothetical protein